MIMQLHTPRLLLRNFQESDLETFLAYRNDPAVYQYQGWRVPYHHEQGAAFIREMKDKSAPKQGDWLQLALEFKETGEMIGDIGFKILPHDIRQAVIGYTLKQSHWRKGLAVEALTALLDYLFEDIDLHRVMAECDVENAASYRTLEKLGFRREGHFIESFPLDGAAYGSEFAYAMLQREWRGRK